MRRLDKVSAGVNDGGRRRRGGPCVRPMFAHTGRPVTLYKTGATAPRQPPFLHVYLPKMFITP